VSTLKGGSWGAYVGVGVEEAIDFGQKERMSNLNETRDKNTRKRISHLRGMNPASAVRRGHECVYFGSVPLHVRSCYRYRQTENCERAATNNTIDTHMLMYLTSLKGEF
jgi:hypothetical protein